MEEIAKHSQLMNKWWDLRGPMSALHAMNEIRVPFIRDGMVQVSLNERTKTPLLGKKLLDVGCGGGILSEPLAALGAEVTGIDGSKELIELAVRHSNENKKLANNKPTYYQTSIEDHAPKYEHHYDGVVASEVIEHVTNKEMFVDSCIKVLKPGGRIFFTTPNRTRLTQFAGIFLAEYVFNIVPKGTHQYDKLMTPTELSFLLERSK
ncbi:Ubiquinone biosynthesis O-methyltransferase, mitochondrial [Eumeta japonica]|uniref:Ubiquinone biosynthesis O-methyltransferase, mitochondrial n=1 Tax=Eumeta variegata TaxID=151549 RepID=A0A4C1ZY04_EUMVA|nr:Ubiquinone biosynthesis O-methyltransferase, mitochondrial [Eumeta japonica]